MPAHNEDSTTRTGLWVVFTTVTILLISLIIWVLKQGGVETETPLQASTQSIQPAGEARHDHHRHHGHHGHHTHHGDHEHHGAAHDADGDMEGSDAAAAGDDDDQAFVAFDTSTSGAVSGVVHFASASADIPADAKAALATVVAALKASEGRRVLLAGYHDPTGNLDYNRELAKKRALGVRDALVAEGITIERIILRKPEQTAGSGNSHAEARRVDLVLVD